MKVSGEYFLKNGKGVAVHKGKFNLLQIELVSLLKDSGGNPRPSPDWNFLDAFGGGSIPDYHPDFFYNSDFYSGDIRKLFLWSMFAMFEKKKDIGFLWNGAYMGTISPLQDPQGYWHYILSFYVPYGDWCEFRFSNIRAKASMPLDYGNMDVIIRVLYDDSFSIGFEHKKLLKKADLFPKTSGSVRLSSKNCYLIQNYVPFVEITKNGSYHIDGSYFRHLDLYDLFWMGYDGANTFTSFFNQFRGLILGEVKEQFDFDDSAFGNQNHMDLFFELWCIV